jgi:hypothetical protein
MFCGSHKLLLRFLPMAAAARGTEKQENSNMDAALVTLLG